MTTADQAAVEALMKLAERLRMAPLSGGEYRSAHADLQTAIAAALAAERERALEDAARVCDEMPTLKNGWAMTGPSDCAQAIRALKAKEEGNG